jgi:Uncharacterized metal-binding protein
MPSGRTHDAITFLLAAPVAVLSYAATYDIELVVVATAAFLFGGLMFGPDLDTRSKPYARWGVFRVLWFPYRSVFKHRSRWSHGLLFGTLFRVVYFFGAVTVGVLVGLFSYSVVSETPMPGLNQITDSWQGIGSITRDSLGIAGLCAAFVGMWLGAASHTVTDIAGSYVTTGKVGEFL